MLIKRAMAIMKTSRDLCLVYYITRILTHLQLNFNAMCIRSKIHTKVIYFDDTALFCPYNYQRRVNTTPKEIAQPVMTEIPQQSYHSRIATCWCTSYQDMYLPTRWLF